MLRDDGRSMVNSRKTRLILLFLSGLAIGGAAGFAGGFLIYYHYYFVQLDGPAGAVARRYLELANDIQDASAGRSRTPQELMDRRTRSALEQSVLAATAYCAMNEGDRKATKIAATDVYANESIKELISGSKYTEVKAALDYLDKAGTAVQVCTPFRIAHGA